MSQPPAPPRPQVHISSDNYAPVVEIVAWLAMSITALAVLTVAGASAAAKRQRLTLDTGALYASLFFCICQTVCMYFATHSGLGQSVQLASNLEGALKALYAGHFFYALSLMGAKLTVTFMLSSLTPLPREKMVAYVLAGTVSVWTLTSLFVFAFACRLPTPWDLFGGHCINRRAWWTSFELINVTSDFVLVLIPCAIICTFKLPLARKVSMCALFSIRLLNVAPMAAKIWSTFRESSVSGNSSLLDLWIPYTCTQLIQMISIVAAASLYLKPVLGSVQTGWTRPDDRRRRGIYDELWTPSPGLETRGRMHAPDSYFPWKSTVRATASRAPDDSSTERSVHHYGHSVTSLDKSPTKSAGGGGGIAAMSDSDLGISVLRRVEIEQQLEARDGRRIGSLDDYVS